MDLSTTLEKLRQICSRQEKCPADVVLLLKRWGIPQEQQQGIVDRLITERFLDEHRYATAFINDKLKFDHWGTVKIRYMLQQKGISRAVADHALQEINREEYRTMVRRELVKKRKSLKGSSREIWAKLARYGSSRGYEMEVMRDFLGGETPDE
jgi:regulatory protein